MSKLLLFSLLMLFSACVNTPKTDSQTPSECTNSIDAHLLFQVWGEVNKHVPTHRGKMGLHLLEMTPDYRFKSCELLNH